MLCKAAVPDANALDSTVKPSCSKYLRLSATKYATLFIWLIEPPTAMVIFFFSSAGLSAAVAGPPAANTDKPTAEIAKKCFMVFSVAFDVTLEFLKSERLVLENVLQHVAGTADVDA